MDGAGGKNSSYFYSLEKRRQTEKCITKLNQNGNIIQDTNKITEEVCQFYSNLYKKKFQSDDCDAFLNSVKENVVKLTDEDKFLLERDVSLTEIETALKQMKNSKSPGIDGLSVDFFFNFLDRY